MWNSSRLVAEISDELCREHRLSVVQNPQNKTVSYEKWEGNQSKLTSRDSLRITIDAALRMQPDRFDALMQLMEEAGCWIKRGAHVSIKPPGGERYIRLDSLGAEYSEAKLRQALDGHHAHIPKIPRSEYNYSQVKRLIDVEAKLREGKGKGYMIWAERNIIDAKAQSIIFLKEHNIGSIDELENQINMLRSERNALHAAIREKQNRMKEINELRQAIRDYRRTKDVYAQYKASGWSPKFYNEHRKDIESHKKAQAVYSTVDGKMPTLKELSAEYDALKAEKESDDAVLEELKPQLTTLNHIKYTSGFLMLFYIGGPIIGGGAYLIFKWLPEKENEKIIEKQGGIRFPNGLTPFSEKKYFAVEDSLRSAGFKNISCVNLHDSNLLTALVSSDKIDKITINGSTIMSGGKIYMPDVPIVITYQ